MSITGHSRSAIAKVEPIARKRGPAISASAASPGFKGATLQVSEMVADRAVRERDPALLEDRSQ
jgi:hypothetical protein